MAPSLHWVRTVYNGMDTDGYPFEADKEDYVLWMGRMNPDKGAHLAIDIARKAGCRIVLAGKCTEQAERDYFEEEISPRLGDGAEWTGEADLDRKKILLAHARCLLFPLQWEEPFGIVMAEAMACGTPVVALGRGSVPEVVVDGVTGFVRREPAELVQALDDVDQIDPKECRRMAEERFGADVMVSAYERVYEEVLGRA
jgi:glycosyltransferase involved in cell wall biosynthesis